jgi:hypothetical protein
VVHTKIGESSGVNRLVLAMLRYKLGFCAGFVTEMALGFITEMALGFVTEMALGFQMSRF